MHSQSGLFIEEIILTIDNKTILHYAQYGIDHTGVSTSTCDIQKKILQPRVKWVPML